MALSGSTPTQSLPNPSSSSAPPSPHHPDNPLTSASGDPASGDTEDLRIPCILRRLKDPAPWPAVVRPPPPHLFFASLTSLDADLELRQYIFGKSSVVDSGAEGSSTPLTDGGKSGTKGEDGVAVDAESDSALGAASEEAGEDEDMMRDNGASAASRSPPRSQILSTTLL
ncbi:hypothetical protein JCM8097_002048 [Rhodosporidiobolus ruineniae]